MDNRDLGQADWPTATLHALGLTVDFSRLATADAPDAAWWQQAQKSSAWIDARDAMLRGEAINTSEGRPVGHVALRLSEGDALLRRFCPDGHAVGDEVVRERQRQRQFANEIRDGQIADLVHIGIGGSDLGPRLLAEVLPPLPTADGRRLRCHFIANVDAHEREAVLSRLDPNETLVLIASKTFTTAETMANAERVRAWLGAAAENKGRLVALTAAPDAARAWGISDERIFPFWPWVGGRYSLWGSVSLVNRIVSGNAAVDDLLRGAAALDQHFANEPLPSNLPALAAHWDYWHRLRCGIPTRMLSAYDQRLSLLLPYLQQLSMESLGKSVNAAGDPLTTPSSAILWGGVGTGAQHAFFQQLHQGDQRVAIELVGVVHPDHADALNHRVLHANLLAQAEVLYQGDPPESVAAYRRCRGGHAVSIYWLSRLDAYHLGVLIAFWEQRTLALGALLGVNPFDQWGVERGKQIAKRIELALADTDSMAKAQLSSETAASVAWLRGQQGSQQTGGRS